MARLVTAKTTLERWHSRSWHEVDYQRLILDRSKAIFPRWLVGPFSPDIRDADGDTHRADLALVDPHYREWWVVEVELEHHDLYGHVLPQVRTFARGEYGRKHAEALARHINGADYARLLEMMLGKPPNVLVVVDSLSTGWRDALEAEGAHLAIAEPFRGLDGQYVLRINGHQPEPLGEVLTTCRRQQLLKRLWTVESPAALPPSEDGEYTIYFEGSASLWSRVSLKTSVALKCRGEFPSPTSRLELIERSDSSLEFRIPNRRRPR